MSGNQQPNHDLLEEAIHTFQRMSVPERPLDAEVLAQFGTRQAELSQPSRTPLPSHRRFRRLVMVSSTAAAVLLCAGLALFLRNSSPPEPARVAATNPAAEAESVAGEPPRGENRVPEEGHSSAAVDSLEDRLKESQVIVVATAEGSSPALPEVPGDGPEVFIQFKVKRVLKGEMAGKVVTTRTSVAPNEIIGRDWIVWLSPAYIAGTHQRAALTSAHFEPRLEEMLANEKK
jgi:hypothetical protein